MSDPSPDSTSVAVIGMSGRFPGAASVAALWENLKGGREAVRALGDDELRAAGVGEELLARPNYVKSLAVLEGAEHFDPGFFGYSAGQAARIDPQHRLFLECAWEAIEHAGYDVERYAETIGVFAGASPSSYLDALRRDMRSTGDAHQVLMDSSSAFMAMRVSYKLDLRGPSIAVQTACSTSLVAVHLACQSLLNFECSMALAGGASVSTQLGGYLYDEGGIMSPDGHCRAYDAGARGTAAGSGVAIVLLKRLADAVRDGDAIHAVIRGTAVNNDGTRKVGFAAPAFHGQVDVLSTALAFAGVEPRDIGYIEGHGTGTVLGDAIELAALTEVFRGGGGGGRSCALGSLKTNIGHLDATAGVAGLIKAVLCLEHGALVPSLNFSSPNPALEAPDCPFFVNTELRPWPADGRRRMAGVSSFGMGGTNAHAVLEEGPARPPSGESRRAHVFPLSARSAAALTQASENLGGHLRGRADAPIGDVAYTLQVGRRRFRHRWAIVAADAAELLAALSRPPGDPLGSDEQDDRPLVFVFPGADVPPAAAADLYGSEPAFRDELDRCVRLVAAETGFDARRALLEPRGADPGGSPWPAPLATFVLERCLGALWLELGLMPVAVIGRGAGELAAACAAGALSVEEAARRIAERARAAQGGDAGPGHPPAPVAYAATGAPGPSSAAELLRDPRNLFLQISPTPSIEGQMRRAAGAAHALAWLAPHRDGAANDPRDRLAALASLWVRGATVDWSRHHAGERRLRVPLPTYPFERQLYRLGDGRGAAAQPPGPPPPRPPAAADERLPLEQWFYIPSWRASLSPPPAVLDDSDRAGRWLIFADRGGLGAELHDRLQAHGCPVVTVHAGDDYASVGGSTFVIDPDAAEHHRRLWDELAGTGAPRAVIYCWSLTPRPDSAAQEGRDAPERGFSHLVRAAARARVATLDILALTSGAHAVAGEDAPYASRAGMAGLCRVAAQEAPGWRLAVIDLPAPAGEAARPGGHRDHADWILSEARRLPSSPLVAYRGRSRLVHSFERVELGSSGPPVRGIRPGGTYVVTGGLGAIGLALATHLAQSQPVNLALFARAPFPAREDWEGLLARGAPGELLHERIHRLRQLEQGGSKILVLPVDVSRPDDVRAAVERVTSSLGPIRGAFHLAADTRHPSICKPIAELEPDDFEAQLRPKLHGLHALAGALVGQPMDFGVVFSSNASVLGGLGFGAYAAANACVDQATAALGRSTRVPWMAINWDGWLLSQDRRRSACREPDGALARFAIDGEEGMAALMRIVAHGTVPQVVVSAADLGPRLRTWVLQGDRGERTGPAGERAGGPAANHGAPATDLERAVAGIWEEVLGVRGVGLDDDFFSLGGDSLNGLRVLVRIREMFQVDVLLETLLEDAPTVSRLVVEIVSQLARAQRADRVQEHLRLVERGAG